MKKLLKVSLFFLIILLNETCFSQSDKSFKAISFDFGFGKSPDLFNGNSGTSMGAFIYYSINKNTLSVRSLGCFEYVMRAGASPVESYSDLSLMWGYKILGSKFNGLIPMFGVGSVESIKRGKSLGLLTVDAKHEKIKENTYGFSFGIRLLANSKHFGYSCYLFSNTNNLKSYYGFIFCFGIGKFY